MASHGSKNNDYESDRWTTESENSDSDIKITPGLNLSEIQKIIGGNAINITKDTSGTGLYKHSDRGPFNKIIENIRAVEIAIKLNKFKVKNINSIILPTKNKVRVNCNDGNGANQKIKLNQFQDFKEFKIYIPNSFVHSYGVLRNIPVDFDVKLLKQVLKLDAEIVNVERMSYWDNIQSILS